ncbi:uncharacterized protein PAC_14882 [Phialocephala subalpina]|uniref:Uncharacterized protein n=1 Tax=Phialocephala subalpina TaxID=576137 RepID=A0A1L7XIW6_9HELO|nr:uncharacterized protein PAC_14882 [Phialocephala subalpina]
MPPKRKTLSSTSGNASAAEKPRNAKAAKTSPKQTATKASSEKKEKKGFKYSNQKTLENKPKFMNLQWPNIADFINDPDCQDMPKKGELIDEYCFRVSDLGLPVSGDGIELLEHFTNECENRDQDIQDVIMYNDWNGWGIMEAMDNFFKDFDKVVFKKTVSPYRKWGFVEAIACWGLEDSVYFFNNEDGDGVAEHADMIGTMILTCIDVLKEHDLFKVDSDIKNIPIICLILLQFAVKYCNDLGTKWGAEVVHLCDDAGIDLAKYVRKQVRISDVDVANLRGEVENKREEAPALGELEDGDGYEIYRNMKDWTPEDDVGEDGRMWYRWDWKLEYKEYKKNHVGGTHFDLTKMTKAQIKKGRHPLDPR